MWSHPLNAFSFLSISDFHPQPRRTRWCIEMQTFAHVVRKVLQSSAADDTDLQIQNALLNFSNPCKPVLSAVILLCDPRFIRANQR
jgi:hypothetical protein